MQRQEVELGPHRRRHRVVERPQGVEHDAIAIESFVHLRYAGTDTALPVPLSEPGFMRRDFEALHRQRFGFISPEKDIVAAAIEVAAASDGDSGDESSPLPVHAKHGSAKTPG